MDRSTGHIGFLDQIRGIAVLGVFFFHVIGASFKIDVLPWSGWFRDFNVSWEFLSVFPLSFGSAGVAVFFAVSGFCIHLSFLRSRSWQEFFNRRFFRIYPPYLVALIVFAAIVPFFRPDPVKGGIVAQFFSHLLLVHNFDDRFFFGINPSFWSIAIEVQLYLLYPAVVWISHRFGWKRTILALGVLEGVIRLAAFPFSEGFEMPLWLMNGPFTYWFSWAIGAYLAHCHVSGLPFVFARISPRLAVLAGVLVYFVKPLYLLGFPLFAIATASAIARTLDGRLVWNVPGWLGDHLSRTGIRSYSVYLLHQPPVLVFAILIRKFSGDIRPLGIFLLCLGSWFAIQPIAEMYYRYVEIPTNAFGKRLSGRRSKPALQAEAAPLLDA